MEAKEEIFMFVFPDRLKKVIRALGYSVAQQVIGLFLYFDRPFRPVVIARLLELPEEKVEKALRMLNEAGLVGKVKARNGDYYYLTDRGSSIVLTLFKLCMSESHESLWQTHGWGE